MSFRDHRNRQPAPIMGWQPPSNQPQQHQYAVPPPPGYQQAHFPPPSGYHSNQRPPRYHPRVGFINLPTRFHVWNVMTSGGSSILNLGPDLKGPVAYSAKMFSASRLKIKQGPYQSAVPAVCTIESRHTFSSESNITFDGFQTRFKEKSMFNEGATWPFDVQIQGHSQSWQWRKGSKHQSTVGKFFGAMSTSKIGLWELIPVAGNHPPAAAFVPSGGNTLQDDAALGLFEFFGPASVGGLGDEFINVSVAVLLRIISQHYIGKLASMAG